MVPLRCVEKKTPGISTMRHVSCLLAVIRDQGSLMARYRQPQPKAKLARGTARGPLNSSYHHV